MILWHADVICMVRRYRHALVGCARALLCMLACSQPPVSTAHALSYIRMQVFLSSAFSLPVKDECLQCACECKIRPVLTDAVRRDRWSHLRWLSVARQGVWSPGFGVRCEVHCKVFDAGSAVRWLGKTIERHAS